MEGGMSEAVELKELLRRKIEKMNANPPCFGGFRFGTAYGERECNTCPSLDPCTEQTAERIHAKETAHLSSDAPTPLRTTAQGVLSKARDHMLDRAAAYDKPEGERSMRRTVEAFNAITGRDLEESEGWLLLQVLKDVRDRQRREPHGDSLEDCVAYAALKAEARLAGK